MFQPTLVQTAGELRQIHELNKSNLRTVLSEQAKQETGFLTWLYSEDLLTQLHQLAPSVIVKDGDRVAGYALVTLRESGAFHPDLQTMLEHIETLSIDGRPLGACSYYVMGQVCVHPDYRGKGIFSLLYEGHRQFYSQDFDLLITEVSTSNFRSIQAHNRVGFQTIHTYRDTQDEWNVVVWNWQKG